MQAGGVFLPDIAALVVIDAAQFAGIGFQPENLVLAQFAHAPEYAERQPVRPECRRSVALVRWRDPAMAKLRQAGVERLAGRLQRPMHRPEEHTSELQSLMRSSYAVFCLKRTNPHNQHIHTT